MPPLPRLNDTIICRMIAYVRAADQKMVISFPTRQTHPGAPQPCLAISSAEQGGRSPPGVDWRWAPIPPDGIIPAFSRPPVRSNHHGGGWRRRDHQRRSRSGGWQLGGFVARCWTVSPPYTPIPGPRVAVATGADGAANLAGSWPHTTSAHKDADCCDNDHISRPHINQ